MTFNQAAESVLGKISRAAPELFEQLPVRQAADSPDVEKELEMPEGSPLLSSDHR